MNQSETWDKEKAQQNFLKLLEAATHNPQLITDQEKVVAVIVEAEIFQKFLDWNKQQKSSSLAEALIELQQICAEENYTLEIPERVDRSNPFSESLISD